MLELELELPELELELESLELELLASPELELPESLESSEPVDAPVVLPAAPLLLADAAVLPLSAPLVEPLPVPDWLPVAVLVSTSIGGPPVLLLDPSVSDVSGTAVKPPHAALNEINEARASP